MAHPMIISRFRKCVHTIGRRAGSFHRLRANDHTNRVDLLKDFLCDDLKRHSDNR